MINKLSNYFVDLLMLRSSSENSSSRNIYLYGAECLLNISFTTLLLLIWGIITKNVLSICIWIFCFSLLRNHTGGFHAPSQISCIISSTILGISSTFMVYLNIFNNMNFIRLIYVIGFIYFMILAPLEHPNKPIKKEKRIYHKICALTIVSVEFILLHLLPLNLSLYIVIAFVHTISLNIIELLLRIIKSKMKTYL